MNSDFFKESFKKLSDEKKNKILDTAIIEFAERGFDNANINTIALNAGVSVGSMYKYFDNKEDLFLSVIHYCVVTLKSILYEVILGEESFEHRVEKIIKAIQTHSRENVHLTKLYNEMATESRSSLVWKIVSDMENTVAELYHAHIREAQEAGLIRKEINPNYFAFFLDNLFVTLQFSYACEYYKERMKLFIGEDVFDKDELVVQELMKFIRGAFFVK